MRNTMVLFRLHLKLKIFLLYTHNKQSPRLLLTGLGPKKELTVRRFKQVIGAAIIAAQSKKAQKISVLIPKEVITAFDPTRAISQATVAATVAAYSFDEYKQKDTRVSEVTSITSLTRVSFCLYSSNEYKQ